MASKFLAQLLVLLHNRQVSVATAPFRDPFASSAHALAGCLGLDGHPPKPGHFVSSTTSREGLMALPRQGQRIDLR
jgi:hypothetical protein